MPQTSVLFGLALCGLTVFGMIGTAEKLATAFVPMMLGIPLVFCGIVSLNPHRKKIWLRMAATVGLLGATLSALRLVYQIWMLADGEPVNRFALALMAAILGLCGAFLTILAIASWRYHRRRRLKMLSAVPPPHSPPSPASTLFVVDAGPAADAELRTLPTPGHQAPPRVLWDAISERRS